MGINSNITQLCWVDAQKGVKLWANAGNKVLRFDAQRKHILTD